MQDIPRSVLLWRWDVAVVLAALATPPMTTYEPIRGVDDEIAERALAARGVYPDALADYVRRLETEQAEAYESAILEAMRRGFERRLREAMLLTT